MKKILLSAIAIGAGVLICFAGNREDEATVRKNFIKSCQAEFPKDISTDLATEYCSCSANIVFKKYSIAEFIALEDRVKKGDESVKEELMKVVKPCLDELKANLEEAQNKK
jgi:hypothetical protein